MLPISGAVAIVKGRRGWQNSQPHHSHEADAEASRP
jgi:hypothetical protein